MLRSTLALSGAAGLMWFLRRTVGCPQGIAPRLPAARREPRAVSMVSVEPGRNLHSILRQRSLVPSNFMQWDCVELRGLLCRVR